MLAKSNETLAQTRDSFFDDGNDDDEINSRTSNPQFVSSIRIVTSKPPVYRRESDSSNSPSPSSCCSDHDVTDVSSIVGEHHHAQQENGQQNERSAAHNQRKLGSSVPTSRPPSPANPQQALNKKQVRIANDDEENPIRNHHRHHRQQQPYIHGHTKDYRRIRLTSSAINRQKQQQRIERENLKLLERLQQTRATRGLKRDELLDHYDRQIGYLSYTMETAKPHVQIPTRPSSAAMMLTTNAKPEKKSNNASRPSSASHAINSNSLRSRPGSAPTSLHGSSRSSSSRRPIWNDRWQQQE